MRHKFQPQQLTSWFSLPWLLLIVSLALVASQVHRPAALLAVWIPWAETGILAVAITPIILSGGIDLSVGSVLALCATVEGVLWSRYGWPIGLSAGAAVATGVVCGWSNGALVALGLSPLVATLATMALYGGLAMTVSGAARVTGFPEWFVACRDVAGLPTQFWLLGVVTVCAYVIVHHMKFGRQCQAIGDNRRAAAFAAIPVRRIEWSLYTASGLASSLVAVLYTIDRDAAIPDAHRGVELQAIACVVVGGTSITGGRGGILRTVLGLAVIANLDIGLAFLSSRFDFLTAESRLVMIGILLIAVAVWNEQVGLKSVGTE